MVWEIDPEAIEAISNEEAAYEDTLKYLASQGEMGSGIGNQWNAAQERLDRKRILRNAFYALNEEDETE